MMHDDHKYGGKDINIFQPFTQWIKLDTILLSDVKFKNKTVLLIKFFCIGHIIFDKLMHKIEHIFSPKLCISVINQPILTTF